MKSYQDTFAVEMAKYGMQRGIEGSETRHKSTGQYYRDMKKLAVDLIAKVVEWEERQETAQEELRRAKKRYRPTTAEK